MSPINILEQVQQPIPARNRSDVNARTGRPLKWTRAVVFFGAEINQHNGLGLATVSSQARTWRAALARGASLDHRYSHQPLRPPPYIKLPKPSSAFEFSRGALRNVVVNRILCLHPSNQDTNSPIRRRAISDVEDLHVCHHPTRKPVAPLWRRRQRYICPLPKLPFPIASGRVDASIN